MCGIRRGAHPGSASLVLGMLLLAVVLRGRSTTGIQPGNLAVGSPCEHGGRGPAARDRGATPVTTSLALVATVVVLAGVNLWVHVGPSRWQPVTGPLLAVGLLLLGRWAGLGWEQMGLGPRCARPRPGLGRRRRRPRRGRLRRGARGAGLAWRLPRRPARRRTATGGPPRLRRGAARRRRLRGGRLPRGAVGAARPRARRTLGGRADLGAVRPVARAPGGRRSTRQRRRPGCRQGQRRRRQRYRHGPRARAARHPRPSGRRHGGVHRARRGVFAVLREQSGSLVAPFLLHWAANGLGILAAAWAWTVHAE